MEVQFDFVRILAETAELNRISSDFLTSTAHARMDQFIGQLKTYQRESTTTSRLYRWEIPEDAPICTVVSEGAYETGDAGGEHRVYAAIDGVWQIYSLPSGRRAILPATFSVEGPASIRIRLLERTSGDQSEPTGTSKDERQLAMWRMELGNVDAPGCHFHVQVLGQTTALPFPKSLSIPRLPSTFVTPAAAIEFAIAELFQVQWRRHASENAPLFSRWGSVQRARWQALLTWQLECAHDPDFGSPWTAFKVAKPRTDLFLERG